MYIAGSFLSFDVYLFNNVVVVRVAARRTTKDLSLFAQVVAAPFTASIW